MFLPLLRRTDDLIERPADSARRSFAKAVTWRVLGSIDTFVLAYLFTGHAAVAAGISVTEMFTKIVLYYFHERAWSRLRFGRPADRGAGSA